MSLYCWGLEGKAESKEACFFYIHPEVKMVVKGEVAQLCLTLCNPYPYIVHGILQARILEWVAFPFSRGSSQPRYQTHVSHIAGGFFTR